MEATDNQPWGPHGTTMGEIAKMTRNLDVRPFSIRTPRSFWERMRQSRGTRGPQDAVSPLTACPRAPPALQEHDIIMKALSKRLNDNGEGNENWRQIYKTMLVIEFLVAQGGEQCPRELAVEFIPRLKELQEFTYVDPTGRDQGINVRNRAAVVGNLLNSPEQIEVRRPFFPLFFLVGRGIIGGRVPP